MFMDLPTIQRLTPPIRKSTRIGECQLMPYSGSIAGRICVPGGGGDESLIATAFGELPMPAGAKVLTDSDAPRCRSGSPARRLTILGILPISYFVGRQRRDSGAVIVFAVKGPTERCLRWASKRCRGRDHVLHCAADVAGRDDDAGRPRSGR